ncbi:MAG: hypothetical protein EBY66_05940, partial [Candidatus Fonsibacter lacus]|nr:hypothetical protein [Candidatus Fonsibacter lacus]
MNNDFANYYFDYIGATGTHTISDYIDYTSNILNDKINNIDFTTINSNITNLSNQTYHINSNNPMALVKSITYSGIPHTYIINSNINGEIRFNTYFSYTATDDPINNYAVKIDNFGKLYVYHKYNILQPTFPAGWYDLEGEVLGLKADGINTDAQLSALEVFQYNATNQITALQALTGVQQVEIVNLQEQVEMLGFVSGNEMYLIQGAQNFETLRGAFARFSQLISLNYKDRLLQATTVGIGLGIPIILSSATDYMNREYYYRLASNFSNAYLPSLTTEQRRILYSCNDDGYNSNTSNYNYYTCNLGIIQGFINSNITNQQFIPNLNTNEIKFNNVDLFDYLPYQSPTPSGVYTTTTIDANTFAYTFTGTGQLIVPRNTIVDILLVGAGGRGGINIYAGGGGAGEVVYYPQYPITAGTYDITIGIDSATTANRISKITKAGVNQLVALGGGNGAYWNYEFTAERTFPPKAYTSTTTRSASTIMGRSCQKYTMTLNTTGITYGSGTYELYVSSVYSTSTSYDGYRMFDYDNTTTLNRWAAAAGQYSLTTGAIGPLTTQYFVDNTYKGDWFVIKLPYPIALTKYTIYQTTGLLDRAPKNFRVYGSIAGTSFNLLQDITGATYTSRIYTNTALSTNTTPYQWYAFVVNNLVGGTNSTLLDIVEFKLYGKEPINVYSSSIGSSGGGGWYNPNLPALVKKGSTFAISQNAQYSKATAGYNPVDIGAFFGGSGGSATGTGRFSTTITGTT